VTRIARERDLSELLRAEPGLRASIARTACVLRVGSGTAAPAPSETSKPPSSLIRACAMGTPRAL